MPDGILSRLKKGAKKRKAKAKAERNRRQRKRARRRKSLEKKKESVGEFAEDVSGILGASRAGGAARVTVRGAKAVGSGAERVGEKLDQIESNTVRGRLRSGEMTVGELKNELEFVSDATTLDKLLRAERAGKDRKGAKDAIRNRKGSVESGDGFGIAMEEEPFLTGGGMEDEPMFGEESIFSDDDDKGRDSFGLDI